LSFRFEDVLASTFLAYELCGKQQFVALRSATQALSAASADEEERPAKRLAYAMTLLRGDGIRSESLALTAWLRA